VRKLVRQQTLAVRCSGPIVLLGEHDVFGCCESTRLERCGRFSGLRISVDADTGKVAPETRLKEVSSRRIERLARRTQYLVHNRRQVVLISSLADGGIDSLATRLRRTLILTRVAFSAGKCVIATTTSALENAGRGNTVTARRLSRNL